MPKWVRFSKMLSHQPCFERRLRMVWYVCAKNEKKTKAHREMPPSRKSKKKKDDNQKKKTLSLDRRNVLTE